MKKIRLDAESLEVLSFTTSQEPGARGTVQAAATGYTCYHTVSRDRDTHCLAYPASYWGEESCRCPLVPYTDPAYCIQPVNTTQLAHTEDVTCATCPGIHPGC